MSLKKLITLENLQSFYNKLPSWSKNSTKPEYNYSEINNTPTLGTAASKDVAAGGGNAGNNEVVMGNDSRLTNSRNPLAHNQASSTIDSMASYSKPSSAPATPAIQASDSLNTAIGKLEYKADTNQTNILSAESMVCDNVFSTSTAYAEGDIVTYNHKLYKFKTAHSAGAWNSSQVDQISTTGLITPELIELCDSGAKNVVDVANATVSANGYVVNGASVSIPAGSYKVSFTTTASSGNLVVTVKNSNSTSVGSVTIAQTAGTKTGDLTVTGTGATLTVQSTSAATISNFMICTQAAWNVSHKYVPYRPNWDLVAGYTMGYDITQNDTAFPNLLANAMAPYKFDSEYTSHTGMIYISTNTENEYCVAYFMIKRGTYCKVITLTNNGITTGPTNSAGTMTISGGTAPYHMSIRYIN